MANHLFFFCDLLSLVQDLSRIGDDLPTAVGSMNVDLWVARYLHWFIHSVFGVISVLYGFICFFLRYGFNVSTMCDLCSTRRILRSMDPPYRDNGNFSPMLALVDIWRFPRIGVLPNNPL